MTPRDKAIQAIKDFNFDNYGLDEVGIAIREDPEAQEWIPDLADAILKAVDLPAKQTCGEYTIYSMHGGQSQQAYPCVHVVEHKGYCEHQEFVL